MTNQNYSSSQDEATRLDGTSEDTILDNNTNNTPVNNAPAGKKAPAKEQPKSNTWKKVTVGTGSAVVLGAAAAFVASAIPVHAAETTGANAPTSDGSDISMATGVNDDMSFSQAFDEARAEVGPGGVFVWHGNLYNTYTATEWDAMSAEEHSEWGSHFEGTYHADNTTHHSDSSHSSHTAEAHQNVHQDAPVHAQAADDHTATQGSHSDNTAHHNQPVAPDPTPDPNEVEVLGVVHDTNNGANYADVMVGEHDIVLVDVDNDHTFEATWIDADGNGRVDDGEVYDTHALFGQDVTVEDLGGFNDPTSNAFLADNEPDYTNDAAAGYDA